MVRHRFLGFGSYVEPVQTRSVFFLDLSKFLRRPQYLYYVETNQSGSSPESLERENTFCTITFQKCKKIKKQLGKYTGSMRSIKKCIKIDLFPIIGSTDLFPKRCRQVVRSLPIRKDSSVGGGKTSPTLDKLDVYGDGPWTVPT